MPLDFARYKPRLTDYLRLRGIAFADRGNFRCFLHDDGASASEWSMHLYGAGTASARLHCYGCGFDGDIFDVCGALDGIDDQGDQYRAVASAFGDSGQAAQIPARPVPAPEPPFVPDAAALDEVLTWLRVHRAEYRAELAAFARARGFDDPAWSARLAWWPGNRATDLAPETLQRAGVAVESWAHSGAVFRAGLGFKLHYLDSDGHTVKRESRGGHTFPSATMPEPTEAGIILVEGELDEISARYAGFDNVRAIGGTNGLRPEDVDSLAGYPRITLAMDNDTAGRVALGLEPAKQRRYKPIPALLREGGYTGRILYADWQSNPDAEGEKDIDDLVKHGKEYVVKHVLQDAKEVPIDTSNASREALSGQSSGGAVPQYSAGGTGAAPDAEDTGLPGGALGVEDPAATATDGRDSGLESEARADDTGADSAIAPDDIPFAFLGFSPEAYYVLPKLQNLPYKMSRGDKGLKDKLNEIASPDWWFAHFNHEVPNIGGEGFHLAFDGAAALEWFRRESIRKGMYNDDGLLGCGAHWDGDRIVVNTGRAICSPDGTVDTYESYRGPNTYCRSKIELKIDIEPAWTRDDGLNFLRQLQTFTFDSELAYYAIAGFCAVAPFASALFRRPHLWITAKKGTGKSYLMNEFMGPVLGGTRFLREGVTTEAAVRQALKKDCRIVLLDEFEATQKKDMDIIKSVMTLARSSYSGEAISKGTPGQEGISFATKNMFCFGSINVHLDVAADASRIVVCRMEPSRGKCKAIKNPDGLRSRIFLRLADLTPSILAAHDLIESMGHDTRTADTYAPFFAGFWMTIYDTVFGVIADDADQARDQTERMEKIRRAIGKIDAQSDSSPDEEKILERIFQERQRISSDTEKTIGEMLTELDSGTRKRLVYDEALQRIGLRRMPLSRDDTTEVLAVVKDHPSIKAIFKDSPFEGSYKEVLVRNAASLGSKQIYIAKSQQTAILLRWGDLEAKYFREVADVVPF
jgi:hypothetical protein